MEALFLFIDSTKCGTKSICSSPKQNENDFASRHATFSPAVSVLGEAAETIWCWVNMAIVKLLLCFTTIVNGSFMFSF